MQLKKRQDLQIFFNSFIKEGLTPNQFYLITCIAGNISPSVINIHAELRHLVADEWLDDKNNLTPKSIVLLSSVENYFNVSKKKTDMSIMGINYMDNIKTYRDLFPKGKLPSGKPARSNEKILEQNFRWFFENYSYTWDTILKATAYYVDEFEKKNFLYMRTAQYFICKSELDKTKQSELADYCSMLESGDFEGDNSHFKENVV
jgi:hypothetical protein